MVADQLIGKRAGNYRLVERLGAGGMGEVYKAVHVTIGSKVAVKLLHAKTANDRALQERFNLEAQAVNRIDHPGVVKILDARRLDNGQPFLIMELLDGKSLHELRKAGALTARQACRAMVAVLDALEAAHQAGVVHRDLKPANIFRTRDGRVVVLDFGIAKLMAKDAVVKLTVTGTAIGTPHYMAPEQIRAQRVTPATDIYAIGVSLFELVCGRRPFEDVDEDAVMVGHLQRRPPPPRALVPELPVAVQDVILRALEKDPAKRYPSAAAMRDALQDAVDASGAPLELPATAPAGAPLELHAAAPEPQRSPWARPGPVDPDHAITQPRARRASQEAPTRVESPQRYVPPPAAIATTQRDAHTPVAVRAHREKSRTTLWLAVGGATMAVVAVVVVVSTTSVGSSSPPASTPVSTRPRRDAVAPVDAAAVTSDNAWANEIDASVPEHIGCDPLAAIEVRDIDDDTENRVRAILLDECQKHRWAADAVRCIVVNSSMNGIIQCFRWLPGEQLSSLVSALDVVPAPTKPAPAPRSPTQPSKKRAPSPYVDKNGIEDPF